ncbi:hypothetical protein BH10ACT4_BH10ACT4_10250 [soil metagenome]
MTAHPLTLVALVIGALALGGCTGGTTPSPAAPSPSAAESSPSASATTRSIALAKDCPSIVKQERYAATFGDTPLNDPGVVDAADAGAVEPTPSPAGATASEMLANAVELHCVWRDPGADITYLEVSMAHVDPAVATGYLTELAGKGYSCTDTLGGRSCGLVKPNEQYPVDEGYTSFLRDDVFISIADANFPSPRLLADMVAILWK